jgi:hypothetical protein
MKNAAQIGRLFKRLIKERYYEAAAALVAETIARDDVISVTKKNLVPIIIATIKHLHRSRRPDSNRVASELYAPINGALARVERGELGKAALRCLGRLEDIDWGAWAEED